MSDSVSDHFIKATQPLISIVIPTYNRLSRLTSVLDALSRQTMNSCDFEVIVVSDGSTDGTSEYLRSVASPSGEFRFPLIIEIQRNQGPAAARNCGVNLASAPVVLFLDDDVVPSPALLERHVQTHRRVGPGKVVIGTMSTPSDHEMSPWVRWEQLMLYKQYEAMISGEWAATARQFYTGNASVERDRFLASGGFDTALRRAEDVELAYRLALKGVEFTFAPDAVGLHYAERSFASWLANATAYGKNDIVIARERDQCWLLPVLRKEFARRDPITRALVCFCLSPPGLDRWAVPLTTQLVKVAVIFPFSGLQRRLLSGLYNLSYYRGIRDELGDWNLFVGTKR